MRLTILLCWWSGWSDHYSVLHVNALANQLREYLNIPFKVVLLTNKDATGAQVDEVLPLPADPEGLRIIGHVNCYRRLRFFDPDYTSQFGTEWVMSVDLDTLIRGDITNLITSAFDHPYGLWIVRGRWAGKKHIDLTNELKGKIKLPPRPYNGAMYMIRVGANAQVWRDFHPINTPIEIRKLRWVGSDQCAISLLAHSAPTWGPEHGMYFFGQYLKERRANPKAQALVLNFAGRNKKPWSKPVKFQAKDIWQEYMRWLDAEQRSRAIPQAI
jgi:hypothetical protein